MLELSKLPFSSAGRLPDRFPAEQRMGICCSPEHCPQTLFLPPHQEGFQVLACFRRPNPASQHLLESTSAARQKPPSKVPDPSWSSFSPNSFIPVLPEPMSSWFHWGLFLPVLFNQLCGTPPLGTQSQFCRVPNASCSCTLGPGHTLDANVSCPAPLSALLEFLGSLIAPTSSLGSPSPRSDSWSQYLPEHSLFAFPVL